MKMFEQLEDRQLMSATVNSAVVAKVAAPLVVTGTSAADVIVVAKVGDEIVVNKNGVKTSVKASLVTNVIVDARPGGQDLICLRDLGLKAEVRLKAEVFNCGTIKIGESVCLPIGADARVNGILGIKAGLHLSADANVNAIAGLFAKLKVDARGNLCGSSGARVDVKAVLGLLTHLGCNTGVNVDAKVCVDLCTKLGIGNLTSKVLVKLSLKADVQLDTCVKSLVDIGVKANVKLKGVLNLGIL